MYKLVNGSFEEVKPSKRQGTNAVRDADKKILELNKTIEEKDARIAELLKTIEDLQAK